MKTGMFLLLAFFILLSVQNGYAQNKGMNAWGLVLAGLLLPDRSVKMFSVAPGSNSLAIGFSTDFQEEP